MSDKDALLVASLHVARTMPFKGPLVDEAFGKAIGGLSAMFDFERELCEAGIHLQGLFHPSDCPERKSDQVDN